ncbi:MAG: hypothetical protein HY037_01670 [Nitrospirae bacterium]|nr:hypothetical protein [Candidatus Troglogloeales bacterium]
MTYVDYTFLSPSIVDRQPSLDREIKATFRKLYHANADDVAWRSLFVTLEIGMDQMEKPLAGVAPPSE